MRERHLLMLLLAIGIAAAQVLTPVQNTISHRKPILATATCGEINGQPIKEVYCSLTGSNQYTPWGSYSYQDNPEGEESISLQEQRASREAFIHGGHGCGTCQAGTGNAHPAVHMVDGNTSWWQSPPLSRGMQYNHINITLDLEQEFHVAFVWLQMANSPKPGTWVLERSVDYGITYKPWYYFAENGAQCMRLFGMASLSPITEDDTVICRTDMSSIQPLENGEIVINLLENRPSRDSFAVSEKLQNFTRATNIRIRLLGTRTLHGHLMDLNDRTDATVTRRYFYSIKEIMVGGRCVCNGHASTCDILDPNRPKARLCRCEHNTWGDMCEQCLPGFEQKKWERATVNNNFTCEPCQCFGRSDECRYEQELDDDKLSLDIYGALEGGGRCLNCRDNTEGINCNKCVSGFYKPENVKWEDARPCRACECDPSKHNGRCAEGTGKCECQDRFEGEDCDRCAKGYYDEPECKPCECAVSGTVNETCLPVDGQCPCKEGFGGTFCETCSPGFTNFTAGCNGCSCLDVGSEHSECDAASGQCVCKTAFSGLACDQCQVGYFGFPDCKFCNCDPSGTEGGKCDSVSGQCLCKVGFAGENCDQCDVNYYGYPNCKACECIGAGTKDAQCDLSTGQCPCNANFTGTACDKCAAGFYAYPDCKACGCLKSGAKGQTCDNQGQCFCKGSFEGERCDRCKPNFYNFPACEECNCNPNGVTQDFGGCDKVAPGELCSCRRNVAGRICDQCKPTFWDLQFHNQDGCVGCDCHLPGTLSALNLCEQKTGQCICKRHSAGRRCDKCDDGFYDLQDHNQHGCEPCNCDVGGALRVECDLHSGQCRCRPRVHGTRCDRPIGNHYYPTLWHSQYEAEDGHTSHRRPVRFAVDAMQFPGFSWRGYAVFSTIQEKIIMEVDITKASVYRLLFRYHNPTPVPITATIVTAPRYTTQDTEQSVKIEFPPTTEPATKEITMDGKPFVLNPGKWAITVETKQRLFLDYIVVLPAEYYEGSILKEKHTPPCEAHSTHNSTCVDLLYPPLPKVARADVSSNPKTFHYVDISGDLEDLELVPVELLPDIVGPAAWVRVDNNSRVIEATIEVPEDGDYVLVVEYHSLEKAVLPVAVDITQEGVDKLNGTAAIHHCPYATFCRELVVDSGEVARIVLQKGPAAVQLQVAPMHQFGLAAVNLIPLKEWSEEYLQQVPVCIRKNGVCVVQGYPPAANAIVTEVEGDSANITGAMAGDSLPFQITNAKDVTVVRLDLNQNDENAMGTIEVNGIVPTRGHYMLIVHYYNPDNTPIQVSTVIQYQDQFSQAVTPFAYCPSVSGCRTLIRDQERPELIQYYVEDKYTILLYHNDTQKGPIYINSVTAVPFRSYNENLMKALPIDLSAEFIGKCSKDHYENPVETVSDYCKAKIFSLTTDFNQAAMSCDCIPQGSESFTCAEYGGQCRCKPNIIGRRCERCAPGHYSYPDCLKCKCTAGQQCDENTGQCFCPQHVEGSSCDTCVGSAFGYDPLIGCQLCGCHPEGIDGNTLQCDANSGQCLCRQSIGGRQCDRCLAGFYSFPNCYLCRCSKAGTTDQICDATNAQCKCKKNVHGGGCNQCKAGTFDLTAENPEGCVSCFCFGTTEQCRSSMFPVTISSVDLTQFTISTSDQTGAITFEEDEVVYSTLETEPAKSVYFEVPIEKGADYTTSYGLMLSFRLSVKPGGSPNANADVRLHGNNMTAEYWASEQPADPQQEFSVRCRLVPENFQALSGKPLTRADLMMMLHSLQGISLKASYFDNPTEARLSEFGLEVSDENGSRDGALRASSVEQCACPAPYIGASCQLCAPGYYRVDGDYLGACVPCDCNGHSGTCDSDTGVCSNCEHNTYGEHCEFCNEGHYGDATNENPYACMPCMCPYPPDNNFAVSCKVSEQGDLQSCNCKPGYTGERCERCDAGHFGEPNRPMGMCRECECNGNNNLTDSGACHPINGHCFLCENHTAGRNCEWCEPWYYGDAIVSKNCTSCSCDQCGSATCDNANGLCHCKQNIIGDNCDRCAPDHFGFSRCRGCEPCYCGKAAVHGQCDDSGQCSCQPGASGLRCERCEAGYWNYGEGGCQICDCESDLSLGTVCDVRTGQCHCQEGATGARCDQCDNGFLRIPTMGCRRCDECVHHLVADVDRLDLQILGLNHSIGNISSATVVGARLSRSSKNLINLEELAKFLTNADKVYENFYGDARAALTSKASLFNNVNRTHAVIVAAAKSVDQLIDDADLTMQDVKNRAEIVLQVVEAVRRLAASIGSHSSALHIDPRWIEDAQNTLMELEVVTGTPLPEKAKTVPDLLEGLRTKLEQFTSQMEDQKKSLGVRDQETTEMTDYLAAAQKELKDAKRKTETAVKKTLDSDVKKFEGLSKAIADNADKANEDLKNIDDTMLVVNNQTEVAKEKLEDFGTSSDNLNEHKTELAEEMEKMNEKKEELENLVEEAKKISTDLENSASSLNTTFGSTRSESQKAVDAANAYKDLADGLKNALEQSEKAVDMTEKSVVDIEETKKTVNSSMSEADSVSELAGKTEKDMKTVFNEIDVINKDMDRLSVHVNAMRDVVPKLRSSRSTALDREGVKKTLEAVAEVEALKAKVDEAINATREEVKKVQEAAEDYVAKSTEAAQGVKSTRSNVKELAALVPKVVEAIEANKKVAEERASAVDQVSDKIERLKEIIANARDAANRVNLGTHFERGSSLDLQMPQKVSKSAAHTDVSLYFRTRELDGIPLFFGNVEGSAGTRAVPTDDYLAVEIEGGKPKVTIDLGDSPLVIKLESLVNDDRWRRLHIDRSGKTATVTLYKPDTDEDIEETKKSIASGTKSVLNLHQTMSKLYVGGIPAESKIASEVVNRDFVGDVEDVQLHGEPVGLWNYREGGNRAVQGAKRSRINNGNQGVSLNGDGYIVHELRHWNPRQKTVFGLEFLTFSPDGLLLYIGKDRDFMTLELSSGAVKLSGDFGSGVGKWVTEGKVYNDGKWHSVDVKREGLKVRLIVDGETVADGTMPGDKADLSVTDYFYLGGTPTGINTRSTVSPLRGCLRTVKINSDETDLRGRGVSATKGLRNSCPLGTVRTVSLLSERSKATFASMNASHDIEVTLRFKTREPSGQVFSIKTDAEDLLALTIDNGFVVASAGDDTVRVELAAASDEQWHYISIQKTKKLLRIDADDLYSNDIPRNNGEDLTPGEAAQILFGAYVGCIGDVTYNGQKLDFSKAEVKEVSLTGCSLKDDVVKTTIAPSPTPPGDSEIPAEQKQAEIQPSPTPEVRPAGSCALPRDSRGVQEDSDGWLFGQKAHSRLEYDVTPDYFDKGGTFAVQIRPTGSNGIILLAKNDKNTDHLALFLDEGHVVLSFDTGAGKTRLRSNRSILDGEWHTVRGSRQGVEAHLIVDQETIEGSVVAGAESLDTLPPMFVGGVPAEYTSLLKRIQPGLGSEFAGCIRGVMLNEKKWHGDHNETDVAPCSDSTETGIYFGPAGGYATLHHDFATAQTYAIDMEVRSRVKTGVLLSMGALEYLTVQFINGSIKYTVDSGGGQTAVQYSVGDDTELCDGHWHAIKIMKKKNLVTLSVDGKSNLHVLKKGKKVGGKDPLYIGGVPELHNNKGLDTREPFVGCIRITNIGKERRDRRVRKKKQLDIAQIQVEGDVNKHQCPVN